MKTLYLDCAMGAAGDMISAALYELLTKEQKEDFIRKITQACIPGVKINIERVSKCGIQGTHFNVLVNGEEETDDHHNHDEHHHHSSLKSIQNIIDSLNVAESVKYNVKVVYNIIAEAESTVHGVTVSEIHFHEVGTMDAVADICCVCMILEMLDVKAVISSPVHVGSGSVHCAHGILPVPAPATSCILKGIPIYGGEIKEELCTPTGAAILKHFVTSYGKLPMMTVEGIGYGMGKKDFEAANCLRAFLGETDLNQKNMDAVVELKCNLDDMSAEKIGFASERLLKSGALEVYTQSALMKKSRPGTILCVICPCNIKEKIIHLIFKYTTTIGIRETYCDRYILNRKIEKISTSLGEVRVKTSQGYGVVRQKYEYDDLACIARKNNLSIDDVIKSIEK